MECCICLNNLTENNLIYLECCKYNIHHTCLIQWLNSNIDNSFSDYNKCVLCKSYNGLIDDYYKNIVYFRNYDNENYDNENYDNENPDNENFDNENPDNENYDNENPDNENYINENISVIDICNNQSSDYIIYLNPYITVDMENLIIIYKCLKFTFLFSFITGLTVYIFFKFSNIYY